MFEDVEAIILCAGQGTRLGCADKPKVMLEIGGKPIASYVVDQLKSMGFANNRICIVVGFKKDAIEDYFKSYVVYAYQEEQLGTAHAAYIGSMSLPNGIKTILVVGGDDSAFYTKETIKNFISEHIENNAVLSLLTAEVENPSVLGRVVRDDDGNFIGVLEKEEINEEQKKIKEVSTGTYCFDRKWFEGAFPETERINGLNEYGLPSLVCKAQKDGAMTHVVRIKDNSEWFGINTKEELKQADKRKSSLQNML